MKDMRDLKAGDKGFAYKNVGFGITTYERTDDEVLKIESGRLFTDCFDSIGMEWRGDRWVFDGGLGMKTYLVAIEDVPEGAFDA